MAFLRLSLWLGCFSLCACSVERVPVTGTCTQTAYPSCDHATPAGTFELVLGSRAQFGGESSLTDKYKPGAFADQMALAYALFSDDLFRLRGVTLSSSDGATIENQYSEVARVIQLASSKFASVYRGVEGKYVDIVPNIHAKNFDGKDAVQFLIDTALENRSEKLVIVEGGKITNVALAMTKEPAIISRIKIFWHASNDLTNVDVITVQPDGMHNINAHRDAVNYVFS